MRVFNSIISALAGTAGVLIPLLVVVTVWGIAARYLFDRPQPWVVEVAEYMLLYITFLGGAWLLRKDGHVRMDLLLNQLRPRTQALLHTITSFAGCIGCLALTWYTSIGAWHCLRDGYSMTSALSPPAFVIFVIIPIGFFLLSVQFLRTAYGYLSKWRLLRDQR